MNSRKHFFTTLFFCLGIFGLIIYSACKKNNCGNNSCKNGGTCINDTCSCPTGYTGSDCGTTWSTQYLGSFTCTQTCNVTVGSGSWTSVISGNYTNGQDTILISNFGNFGKNIVAGVDNHGNVFISPVGTNDIAGSGSLSNGVLKIKYSVISSGYVCNVTMTKQ